MTAQNKNVQAVDVARLVRLHEVQEKAAQAMREALVEIYPIGTVVEATPRNPRHARFRGVVEAHYPSKMAHGFSHGGLIVRNLKTGKIREVVPIHKGENVEIVFLPNETAQARRLVADDQTDG